MAVVEIWTDGGCSPNPGRGGWGAVLRYGDTIGEISGSDPDTTNNRMELMAVISALEALTRPCDVVVHTDSRYVQRGISEWMSGWIKKGWKTATGTPVKNKDLWIRLDAARQQHNISWQWVKGHAGNVNNERADQLATDAISGKTV